MLKNLFFVLSFIVFITTTKVHTALAQTPSTPTETAVTNNKALVNTEPNDQSGNFRFISDDLFTYLRAGPALDYRLLGSVNAGDRVQLLQIDGNAGYAEIIDARQRTGWVETRFISETPSIRQKLNEAQIELAAKNTELSDKQTEIEARMQDFAKSKNLISSLNRQVTQQLELIASLNERLEMRERSANMQWFTRGAVLAIISLIIGYLIGLFGRKQTKSDNLL